MYRNIVELGQALKAARLGIRVGEHPAFGRVGKHSGPNSLHYRNLAIDVTDWGPDMAPEYEGGVPLSWKQRTANKGRRAQELAKMGLGLQVFSPHNDPEGHSTHLHLGWTGGKDMVVTPEQVQYIVQGRWKGPDGNWVTTAPGIGGALGSQGTQVPAAQASAAPVEPPKPPPEERIADWRADKEQAMAIWSAANQGLAQREATRNNSAMAGPVRITMSDQPNALSREEQQKLLAASPALRGALGGTQIGGFR